MQATSSSRAGFCSPRTRRPTKDADTNAVHGDVTAEHLVHVIRDIAAIDVDDGAVFDLETINVREIRDQARLRGFRVRVAVSIGRRKGVAAWDVYELPVAPVPITPTLVGRCI